MATELEQFVEANKERLGEVNASNPQLYSAISMALDYLNKNYFGGTTELKVEIPQSTPVTPVQTTQIENVDRIFTDEELEKHIIDNVWTALDFKEIKIELINDIQQQNFLNLIKKLLGRDTYISRGIGGNYFYADEDLVVGNDDRKYAFDNSPYQKLYYNQIFENLLKPQQTPTKLPSVWDSVYAYSSKDYATPIDYNFLQKAIYSNRRSKDMKLEIARAFGEIKSISKRLSSNWDEVEKNYGKTPTNLIYKYQINDEVFKIIEDKGFDFFNTTQYSDLDVKEWISDIIFPQFEEPLKFDYIKEKLLEWYRNQVNMPINTASQPTTAQHIPSTPQISTITNAKFKIGDKVKITSIGKKYSTYKEMFKKMGFANQFQNNEGKNGDIGTIFGVDVDERGNIIYGVYVELGVTRKYQILIGEEGIELFQPTPLSASKFEVGDWVKLINNDSLVGVEIGEIGQVEKFDNVGDPYIIWQNKNFGYNGYFSAFRFELALKNPKPNFKIGDLVRWKEDISNFNVKKGAVAEVVDFGVYDGNIMVGVEWVDVKTNKKYVNGQKNGQYREEYFELVVSNEKMEETAKEIASKITSKTIQPEPTPTPTSEVKEEEDFEDLADELENLDF